MSRSRICESTFSVIDRPPEFSEATGCQRTWQRTEMRAERQTNMNRDSWRDCIFYFTFLKKIEVGAAQNCMLSRSVVSNPLQPHGLQHARLFHPWDFSSKNTEAGCCFLLQGIFPAQGSNPGLPHCRQTLYCLSHEGSSEKTLIYFYGSCLYYSYFLGTPYHTTPGLLTRNKCKVLWRNITILYPIRFPEEKVLPREIVCYKLI